jgi:endoglucanase
MSIARVALGFLLLAGSSTVLGSDTLCGEGGKGQLKLRVSVPEQNQDEFIRMLERPGQPLALGARHFEGKGSKDSFSMSFIDTLDRKKESFVWITVEHRGSSPDFDFSFETCNTDKDWMTYLEAVRDRVREFGPVEVAVVPTEQALDVSRMIFPEASPEQQNQAAEVASDLALALAWRLAPQAMESECRAVDPEGVNARLDQVAAWRDRNESLIAEVDTRVTEVMQILRPAPAANSVETLRGQVNQILRRELTKRPERLTRECKTLAGPDHELWSESVELGVRDSLAALHVWQGRQVRKVSQGKPAKPADLDAWAAARAMGTGVNIGNTLENTTTWETGWGNPRITREFIDSLASAGFRTVRVPVAWDTYARDGKIQPDKMARVAEVVDWILASGMYCVVNIHWDGGWIDSSNKERFSKTFATFSAEAERKFASYWTQIAGHFKDRDDRLVFEALNEETNFEGTGSMKDAYATLTRVNQLFIDTVREAGGRNANRLLIVTGYGTDITKTTHQDFVLPVDTVPSRLLLSVHYYTPWQFAGMTKDESWGKVQHTWGSAADVAELNRLFNAMQEFSKRHDIPVFVGEFGVTDHKEKPSRVRWMTAVAEAALSRKMVPVLWDTGGDVSRKPPYGPSAALREVLQKISRAK